MVVSKNYKIKEQNGMYYIVPSSVPGCPQFRSAVNNLVKEMREVIFADIMVPHKHYSRSAIIDTINGERNCSAEQSTIYRWNREKMQLERLLVQVEDKSPEAKRTGGDNNCRCAGN